MADEDRLSQLVTISGLLLDVKLSQVKAAASAKSATEKQLSALSESEMSNAQFFDIANAISQLSYQRWADGRRLDLNRTLAMQTAVWLDASDDARREFGKNQVLSKLATRAAQQRSEGLAS